MPHTVASFYQFIRLSDPPAVRAALLQFCESLGLRGTILLAPEGINGNLAGSAENITEFTRILQTGSAAVPAFTALELKFSTAGETHFDRLKIKCKAEIITFGRCPAAPPGIYVPPSAWNALLDDPETLLIDARNSFEIAMGSFPGAIDPQITRFSQFPAFVEQHLDPAKHRKIAMFCTGGIRCEKASALLRDAGFAEVYHLQGGILKYLEEIPENASRWQGDCFVFDRRIALGHGLTLNPDATVPDNAPAVQKPVISNSLDSARVTVAE
jgi:UPF0176 protein